MNQLLIIAGAALVILHFARKNTQLPTLQSSVSTSGKASVVPAMVSNNSNGVVYGGGGGDPIQESIPTTLAVNWPSLFDPFTSYFDNGDTYRQQYPYAPGVVSVSSFST